MGRVKLALSVGDGDAVELVRRFRWPSGVRCPYCGFDGVVRNGRPARRPYAQRYLCRGCGRQFHDLTGTVFAKTKLPPSEALTIAYLYYKPGLSALAVSREVGRKAVERVVKVFGEALEAYFRQVKA